MKELVKHESQTHYAIDITQILGDTRCGKFFVACVMCDLPRNFIPMIYIGRAI
jgi:hypothetical protein